MHRIVNAITEDLPVIFGLFEKAIAFQKAHNYKGWQNYDKAFITADVERKLLFKLSSSHDIAGIFSICFTDPIIWRKMEKGDALYLHRVVLNRRFSGSKIFQHVLDWSSGYACAKDLRYLRMDTWAENRKIISYYKEYGFRFVENYTTPDSNELPLQHRKLTVALLELELR